MLHMLQTLCTETYVTANLWSEICLAAFVNFLGEVVSEFTPRQTFVRRPGTLIPHAVYENDETWRTSARLRFIRLISTVNLHAADVTQQRIFCVSGSMISYRRESYETE